MLYGYLVFVDCGMYCDVEVFDLLEEVVCIYWVGLWWLFVL